MSAEELPTPDRHATAIMNGIDALLDATAAAYVPCDSTGSLTRWYRLPPRTAGLQIATAMFESRQLEAPDWMRIEAVADPLKDNPKPPSTMTTVYAYYEKMAVQYEFTRTVGAVELRKILAPAVPDLRPALGSLACTDRVINRMIAISLAHDTATKCGLFEVDPLEQEALLALVDHLQPPSRP